MGRRQIETIAEFDGAIATGSLGDAVIQGLDLTAHSDALLTTDCAGAVFLGCRMHEGAVLHLTATGALLFPDLTAGRSYHPNRAHLYSYDELMDGFSPDKEGSFTGTVDYRIYEGHNAQRENPGTVESLAERLHDHAIDDALRAVLAAPERERVVGVMGGHALRRGEPEYRSVALIGRALAGAGYFVATGGGPGAMEAANLGAWMSAYEEADLDAALEVLGQAPDYRRHDYLLAAAAVREKWPDGAESLAVPTWFYGHEPTNAFAPHIAKYFSNSLREDGLLAIATAGVVFAPGSAGTVQEIFMDASQNHYATFGVISPMVLFGGEYWREQLPVAPLLTALAGDKPWGDMVAIHDEVDAAVAFLLATPPTTPK